MVQAFSRSEALETQGLYKEVAKLLIIGMDTCRTSNDRMRWRVTEDGCWWKKDVQLASYVLSFVYEYVLYSLV